MPDDPIALLPATGDAVVPEPRVRESRSNCEFCECQLTARGEVLKLSDKAKRFRDHGDREEALTQKISALETELRTLRAEHAAIVKPASDLALKY